MLSERICRIGDPWERSGLRFGPTVGFERSEKGEEEATEPTRSPISPPE